MSIATLPVFLLLGQLPPFPSTDGILAGGADPSIVAVQEADGRYGYYVVSTGRGISISYSRDLKDWRRIGRVFTEDVPPWARDDVPKANGIWAPDLSFHKGLYHLYYSVSSFGSQRSVIGLTVNKTLDPTSPDYRWLDRGKVIESWPGKCDFNAIDPALFVDRDGTWYLFFGSFWSGIKLVQLDAATGKPNENAAIMPVAARPRHPTHAVEAAYAIFHESYYYLFVSWDRCCDGADSDYRVMVGRSRNITGPYVDAEGRALLDGGGTRVLAGDERWRGPGHNSVLTTEEGQWLVHHTYDVQNLRAQRVLQIRPLSWTADGWPKVGEPIFEPKLRPSRSVLKTDATAGDSPAATVDLGRLTSPLVIQGTNDTGYRDPAAVYHNGTFYLYMKGQVRYSWSSDLRTWTPAGVGAGGENPCVIVDGDEYVLFYAPRTGVGVKRSKDMQTWRDCGVLTLGLDDWDWAKGRLTAGFVLDLRREPHVGKALMFFHGSRWPEGDPRGGWANHVSLGMAWSDDLVKWSWPGKAATGP